MHGFLNLLAAAAFGAAHNLRPSGSRACSPRRTRPPSRSRRSELRLDGQRASADEIAAARRQLFIALRQLQLARAGRGPEGAGGARVTLAYGVLAGGGVCARVGGAGARPERARRGARGRLAERVHGARPGVPAPRSPRRVEEGRPVEPPELGMPIEVADYVDFYSSLQHATNLGRMFRPGRRAAAAELAPPAGGLPRPRRHGGAERDAVVRAAERPACRRSFGPSERLDIELEAGFVIGSPSRSRRARADRVARSITSSGWCW